MDYFNNTKNKQRLSQAQKDANDGQWYKEQADLLDKRSFSSNTFLGFGGITEFHRKKVNYDLFNNIINIKDFEYICKPYGAETGELPANFTNRDIVSGKIKVLLGMEMKMPFSWKIVAVNQDATTRREQEETDIVKQFVVNQITKPIKLAQQKKLEAETKGRDLTPQEEEQIQAQIDEETKSMTPDEVKKYMAEKHQDPAELMHTQILEYLIQKERVQDKFNKGWKHTNLSGEEIYGVSIRNGEPCLDVVNPLYFDYDKSPDLDFIEDGEWAVNKFRMSPSQIVANFSSELTRKEIDRIYDFDNNTGLLRDADFTFDTSTPNEPFTIEVKHFNWKSLRKIGFLSYFSERTQQKELDLVDENYRLNAANGDIAIKWDYIPESHECYKILDDIYVYKRPVPGQNKDLDNLYECKLSYYGAACDSLNSPTTSPMDRMKAYQYFHNVLIYRVELLMASDKGKILAVNMNAIPKSKGINTARFQYFMEANKIAYLNPQEEGNRGGQGGDVTNLVKEIDMSLVSQIDKYIDLAEYIEKKCGAAVGITPQMEAQIGPNEAVGNTRQNLVQSSHIIQPYFELHNVVKRNTLSALLETAKVAYSTGQPRKLSYILDDMSIRMLTINQGLLAASTVGLFVANSSKAADAKQAVENLAQAALQNQQANLSDIVKIIRSESVTEAEVLLEASEQKAAENAQAIEKMKQQAQEKLDARQDARDDKKYAHEEKITVLKETERRKTVIAQAAITGASFNPDDDGDNNGVNDFLELASNELATVDTNLKVRKQSLEERKFEHQKEVDKEKIALDKKKLNKPNTSK